MVARITPIISTATKLTQWVSFVVLITFNHDVSGVIKLINIPRSPSAKGVRSRHEIKLCILFTDFCQVNEILQHFTNKPNRPWVIRLFISPFV